MKLYTSRWQNKELADLDATPVGISRGVPRWRTPFRYRMLRMLAPSREIFGIEDPEEFEVAYTAQLDEIGSEKILQALERINAEHGSKPLVLLCWERPGEPCHRRLWASWWFEQTGQEVPELQPGMLPKRDSSGQKPLC